MLEGKVLLPPCSGFLGCSPSAQVSGVTVKEGRDTKAQNPGPHLLVCLHQAMQPHKSNCQHSLTWVLHHTFKFSGKNLINRCHVVPQDPTSYVDCGLFFESLPRGEGKTLNPTTAGSPVES